MSKIKLIIFDLGNILVELGASPFPLEWELNKNLNPREWLYDESAVKFEKGLISEDELIEDLIKNHQLTQSKDEIIMHFSKWVKGLYPDVLETVSKLKTDYKLAILSNTNETHWPILMKDFSLEGHFDYYYASFLLKLAKPDIKIYEHVIKETGFKAEEILFFDDSIDNVNSAMNAGINAVHLVGFEAVKKYLLDNNYL